MRPRTPGPAPRGRSLLPSLPCLVAAALVLVLGACKGRPRAHTSTRAETMEQADTAQASDRPPAPAAPPTHASAQASTDSCELTRELQAWSASSTEKRYAVQVAAQLALMEVVSAPAPKPGDSTATGDTVAGKQACEAARKRDFDGFLAAYRDLNRATVLDQDFVGKLTAVGRQVAAGPRTSAIRFTPPALDSMEQEPDSMNAEVRPQDPVINDVEVPREWLAALVALVVLAGGVLGYALWRLGRAIGNSEQRLQQSHDRQQAQFVVVRDQIDRSARQLQEDVGNAQQTTRDEVKNCFGLVRTEVAMLRERMAESRRGDADPDASSAWSGDSRLEGDRGENTLVLDADPYGMAEWEEATVDVRPVSGGPTAISADNIGVFRVRWVRDADAQARLSVDPSRALGAAFRDKLEAAFRCQGPRSGTDRWNTVQDALCTWDPGTRQGRITRQGVVEEAG
jgi:hypothetical protein